MGRGQLHTSLDSAPNQNCFLQSWQGGGDKPSEKPAHTGDTWANDAYSCPWERGRGN